MQRWLRRRVAFMLGGIATAALAAPGWAGAQYVAPPPDPGFEYIFDGAPTGSDASFDKWIFASSTIAATRRP